MNASAPLAETVPFESILHADVSRRVGVSRPAVARCDHEPGRPYPGIVSRPARLSRRAARHEVREKNDGSAS